MFPEDSRQLADARVDVASLQLEVRSLQKRVDKQTILLRALAVLLFQRAGVTEKELLECYRRCEQERADARTRRCPSCGRTISQRQNRCLYCVETNPANSAFDLLDTAGWPTQFDSNAKEHGFTATPPRGEG